MGKKGGTTTTTNKTTLDPAIRQAAQQNLDIANEVASIGYVPYQGNSIAGFSPQQMSSMQATDQGMSAFGMPSAVDWQQSGGQMQAPKGMGSDAIYQALTGMPAPTDDGSGFKGYSAMPMYNNAISQIPQGQLAAIQSFLMNPQTGAAPTNASVPRPNTTYGQLPGGGFGVTGRSNSQESDEDLVKRLVNTSPSSYFADRTMNK